MINFERVTQIWECVLCAAITSTKYEREIYQGSFLGKNRSLKIRAEVKREEKNINTMAPGKVSKYALSLSELLISSAARRNSDVIFQKTHEIISDHSEGSA